jgi:N2227-like protein
VVLEITNHALKYYNITSEELKEFSSKIELGDLMGAQAQVDEALDHIVRDWTNEGLHERAAIYPQILNTLDNLFPKRNKGSYGSLKVAIPGAGLGRLAHEVSNLGGKNSCVI